MPTFPDLAARWATEGIDAPPLVAVTETREADHTSTVELMTLRGTVICVRHSAPDVGHDDPQPDLPIFLGGALGGLAGTAGLWPRLARRTGGIRVHYRSPSDLEASLVDVLMVFHHYRSTLGLERTALVGHSFGGGVAAGAGVLLGPATAGVVCVAGQREGTQLLRRLAGTPVLIIHGMQDSHIPWQSARMVHADAAEPKHLWLVPGGDHGLADHVDELETRIGAFLASVRGDPAAGPNHEPAGS